MAPTFTDVVIVGAGAAWLSLAWRLLNPPAGIAVPGVVLVDAPAGPWRPPERTWCYWERGSGAYDDLLTASWGALRVRDSEGSGPVRGKGSLRYKMLRSSDLVGGLLSRLGGLARIDAVAPTSETWRRGPRSPAGHPTADRSPCAHAGSSTPALPEPHRRGWSSRPTSSAISATLMPSSASSATSCAREADSSCTNTPSAAGPPLASSGPPS